MEQKAIDTSATGRDSSLNVQVPNSARVQSKLEKPNQCRPQAKLAQEQRAQNGPATEQSRGNIAERSQYKPNPNSHRTEPSPRAEYRAIKESVSQIQTKDADDLIAPDPAVETKEEKILIDHSRAVILGQTHDYVLKIALEYSKISREEMSLNQDVIVVNVWIGTPNQDYEDEEDDTESQMGFDLSIHMNSYIDFHSNLTGNPDLDALDPPHYTEELTLQYKAWMHIKSNPGTPRHAQIMSILKSRGTDMRFYTENKARYNKALSEVIDEVIHKADVVFCTPDVAVQMALRGHTDFPIFGLDGAARMKQHMAWVPRCYFPSAAIVTFPKDLRQWPAVLASVDAHKDSKKTKQ